MKAASTALPNWPTSSRLVIGRPPYRHAFAMLLALFTLEDFIRVRRLARARESSPPWTERGRHNAGAIRHSLGQKVAGGTSLWKYCNPDTRPTAVLACRRRYADEACGDQYGGMPDHILKSQTYATHKRPRPGVKRAACRDAIVGGTFCSAALQWPGLFTTDGAHRSFARAGFLEAASIPDYSSRLYSSRWQPRGDDVPRSAER